MCGVPFSNITGCKRIPTDFIFLASSQLTTSIHWPWYCTGHVFVVIYFCESMWSFWVESVQVFYCLFIYVLPLKIQLWRGRAGILLTGLTQPHFYACPKPRPGFPAKIGWLGMRIMCQEWSNKSTSRQLIQWASNIKIQLIVICLD